MWRLKSGWLRDFDFERRAGVFAGVTTRALGDVRPPSSLGKALAAERRPPRRWAGGIQVHGRRVRAVGPGAKWPRIFPDTDGFATSVPGLALRALAADCVPVFLVDPVRHAAALLHAGRRGTEKNILRSAVSLLRQRYSTHPRDLLLRLGPHIRSCCYEVGPEAAQPFRKIRGAVTRKGKRLHLDLATILRRQALALGLSPAKIATASPCTAHNPLFFSYRRDSAKERQAAILALAETHG